MNQCEMIKEMIFEALEQLYHNDKYLINNDNINFCSEDKKHLKNYVSERAVVFRFGIYFNDLVKEKFFDYHLDCEYNRNIDEKKRLPSWKKGAIPDIILHKRGDNENNLLVIEFKTW